MSPAYPDPTDYHWDVVYRRSDGLAVQEIVRTQSRLEELLEDAEVLAVCTCPNSTQLT